ncbi:MAG: CocE/NonD family hydrolase [Candidatus Acidiferrales bacterium]
MRRTVGCLELSRAAVVCALLLGLAQAAGAQSGAAQAVKQSGVAVAMRDGVVLRAEVWRPAGEGKFPTLVYRTPYGAKRAADGYSIFEKAVERGYAVVIQDVRGRYASDGEFLPYQQEGRDGYDTIEWAARQPWSDGNVGTFGLSYPGAVQWLAAMEHPPHLRAMVPAMTFSSPRNFFYSGGVFDLSWIAWIWNNIAPDVRVKKNLPGPKTGQEAREALRKLGPEFQRRLPLNALHELKGVAPWYFEWMRHEPWDSWWDWAELRGEYGRADGVAVLNFSSWHDEAYGPEGATTNFNGLRAARSGAGDAKTQLVLGPWSHGVPGPQDCEVGRRNFCPAANIDYDAMVLDWMDCYVRGVACSGDLQVATDGEGGRSKANRQRTVGAENGGVKPAATSGCGNPVRYFVMGANEWREADQWPLPGAKSTPYYLAPGKKASDPGELLREPLATKTASTSFISDPAKPVTDPNPFYSGANDYSELAERDDVLVFDSPPLKQDTEVTGPITAEIYLETDATDTDLWVRVLDVAPDGTAFNLMSPGLDVLRASYRNAATNGGKRELLTPGTIYKLVLPNLMTSNLFRRGHRIRVQISASFFPGFSRNLHTGKLETVSAEMRPATIRIHHGQEHPSRLLLPVIPPE